MRPAFVVFTVAALAQWLLPLSGVWQHERVIARGLPVRIRCAAPDPYDMLRGRYLAVRPAQTQFPKPAGMPEASAVPVWATLVAGEDGHARIETLSLEPVTGPTVIRLVASSAGWKADENAVVIEWPFDRFYLNERLAPGADKLVAQGLQEGKMPVVEIRLLDGRAVLTDVLINGVSIHELVK